MNIQKLIFVLFFFILHSLCTGQTITDTLLNELKTDSFDRKEDLIKRQLELSVKLWSIDSNISDSLLEESFRVLASFENWELLVRARLIQTNRLPRSEGKFNEYKNIDSIAFQYKVDPSLRVSVKSRFARFLYVLRQCDKSIEIYNEAVELAKQNQLPNHGQLLVSMTSPMIYIGDHFTAMEVLLESLELKGKHKGRAYAAIPNVCRKMEDWDGMLKYGMLGLEDAVDNKHKGNQVFAYMQLGYAYMKKGDDKNARIFTEEALRLSEENEMFGRSGILISTLIKLELKEGNIDKALSYEKHLIEHGDKLSFPTIYTHLAMVYNEIGNYRKAIEYSKYALSLEGKRNEQPYDIALYQMEAYRNLSSAYKKQKNYKLAFDSQTKFDRAREIVEGKETIFNISKALNQQELVQQEKILNLEKEQETVLYNEKLNRYKISGLLGLLLFVLGGYTLFQLRKRNNKIANQNQIISKALSEKDILLREIHHRVKNNLQLVSSLLTLQGRSIDDETALQAINEGNNRVRSMALIHQDLYNRENLRDIGVKDYLEKLTQELFSTYRIDENRIMLKKEIQDIVLDVDTLVPLGLIINELITNSLKYAWPNNERGTLKVLLQKTEQRLLLQVSDDGIGYDHFNIRTNSFGSTLIAALTDQLEGEIYIESQNGTDVQILMKL